MFSGAKFIPTSARDHLIPASVAFFALVLLSWEASWSDCRH